MPTCSAKTLHFWRGLELVIFRSEGGRMTTVPHCGYNIHTYVAHSFLGGWGSATLCASPPPRSSIFSNYSFWGNHLVNRDDRHLLAHAMSSDVSFTWQCLSKRTIVFLLRIKLHALHSSIFGAVLPLANKHLKWSQWPKMFLFIRKSNFLMSERRARTKKTFLYEL
jgi:hypothetical protein